MKDVKSIKDKIYEGQKKKNCDWMLRSIHLKKDSHAKKNYK